MMKRFTRLIIVILVLAFILPASAERLDDGTLLSFYEDSVFFGDSRLQAFSRYRRYVRETDKTFLETVTPIAAASICLYAASVGRTTGDLTFTYRGSTATMFAIADKIQPRKVFVMLGLNDLVAYKPEKGAKWVSTIIKKMKKTVPETAVYFFSETPITKECDGKPKTKKYQSKLDIYNAKLKTACEENGAYYIEIAEALKGEDGFLRPDYSSDGFSHLNDDGVLVWLQCMKDYAQEQYDLGLWDPYAGKKPGAPADNAE